MPTSHTPGPWTHKPRARDGHTDTICKGHAAFVQVGCPRVERPILDYPHDNEQTANARLIAAAPELLAAIKALVAEFDAYDSAMTEIGRGHEDYGGQRAAARAAIAKADGGAQ